MDIHKKNSRKLKNEFRETLTVWLVENSSKIGGPGDIIEIDESVFGRRQGPITKTRWVLWGICRRPKECLLKVVDKRNANAPNCAILDNLEPGTTIVTDMWCGYNSLQQYGYTLYTFVFEPFA